MKNLKELSNFYLASLIVLSVVHRQSHWLTAKYENHLLFERIYDSAAKNADQAAEKLVGLDFGIEHDFQAKMIGKTLEQFTDKDVIKNSLTAEEKFLKFSENFYQTLKNENKLSLGLDDLIMQIASEREEAVYFLKQAGKPDPDATTQETRMASRKEFLSKHAQQKNDQFEQSKQAYTQLRQEISSVLTKFIGTGQPASFTLRLERVGGQYEKFNFTVVVKSNTPEAKVADQLQSQLVSIISRVPYFQNKIAMASVLVED